jgi:hypothetical protein
MNYYCRILTNTGEWYTYCCWGATLDHAKTKVGLYMTDVEGVCLRDIVDWYLVPWEWDKHGNPNFVETLS